MDRALGARALRRLVTGFFLCFLTLSILYSVRGQISSVGYADFVIPATTQSNSSSYADDIELIQAEEPEKVQFLTKINTKTCAERRKYYKTLIDRRSSTRKLKFDDGDNLAGLPYVLSKSQKLDSNTCWTAGERLAPLKHAIDPSLNDCNALQQTSNRTAMVLRLELDNIFTDDAILNLRGIIAEVGWYFGFDVHLLQIRGDEYDENKVPEEFRTLLTNFDRNAVFDGYPESTRAKDKIVRPGFDYDVDDGSHYATTFYQFPQTWFFDHKKEYSFMYFIDSHARHTISYNNLFQGLVKQVPHNTDLVSLDPIEVTKPSAMWSPDEAARPESYYKGKFILHGISRRLASAMKTELLDGLNAPHDAFLPAVAAKTDAKVVMFAHPVMKRQDSLIFKGYTVPYERNWSILNLHAADSVVNDQQVWQHGGTYFVDAIRWVDDALKKKWIDDMYQTWIKEPKQCLPALLIYPVSGR